LKKRSYKLEEEKAEWKDKNQIAKATASQPTNHQILSIQKAISSNDIQKLTDTIYEAKKNQS